MAFSKHPALKNAVEEAPQKITIVAGPSFGDAMRFVVFGAALGAAATYALLSRRPVGATSSPDAVLEGLSAGGGKESQELVERLNRLQSRLRNLAARTKDTVHTARETLGPAFSQAVQEGRKAAQEAETNLADDLKNPAPTEKPNIAAEQA